jgi:type VI secretion system protein ImpB
MAGSESNQKNIGRNRAPRVQIEYETSIGGAKRKVDLAHVMGVMSDLSGESRVEKPTVKNREFNEIDAENFDSKLSAIQPRVVFEVDNVLTDESDTLLPVDIEFDSMNDFSPGAIASKIGGVNELLEARNQLKSLMSYMDGRENAEDWLADLLKDEALLRSVLKVNKDS